jgi:hypothetical protein
LWFDQSTPMENPQQEIVWYKKKRYIIPAGLLGLSFLLGGGNAPAQIESITSEPSIPVEIESEAPIPTKEVEEVETVHVSNPAPTQSCHPSYSGCLNPNATDYDCAGGSGNGPYYTGTVRVIGPDVFGLDRDGDGIGC